MDRAHVRLGDIEDLPFFLMLSETRRQFVSAVREPVSILRMDTDPPGRLSSTEGKAVSSVPVLIVPFGSCVALLASLSIKQRYNKSVLQVAARFK